MGLVADDLSQVPGAVAHQLQRQLEDGGLIEFEEAPAGWLTNDGEIRKRDYRAYYWTPQLACVRCGGDGRVNGVTRVKKCPDCRGTGETRRTRMTSVSTVLDTILPKPGLPEWYERHGIEGTIYALNAGAMPMTIPPERAVAIVRDGWGAEAARDSRAEAGINIHDLLREYMVTGNAPSNRDVLPEDMGYYRALCRFLAKVNPEPLLVEELVCHPTAGYAGRSDLVGVAQDLRIRWDAKTNERAQIYPGAHVQVKLYENGGLAIGDEPSDLLKVVVFAADGQYDEQACASSDSTVSAALNWLEEIRPINNACESRNRAQKERRA